MIPRIWPRRVVDDSRPAPLAERLHARALFCVVSVAAMAAAVVAMVAAFVVGAYMQAAICSSCAVANSLLLLRGLYDAEQQVRWRRQADRDRLNEMRAGLAAAMRRKDRPW
jgi:hypothetical protein